MVSPRWAWAAAAACMIVAGVNFAVGERVVGGLLVSIAVMNLIVAMAGAVSGKNKESQ